MIAAMFVMVILVGIFLILVMKSGDKTKNSKKSKNENSIEVKKESDETIEGIKRQNNRNLAKKDIFDFMEFDFIEDDMIIQNGGNRFTMVIQCKGINYDLMSEIEQLAVEEGFIVFLNTLKFPVQLYVQARNVDLKKSLEIYHQRVDMFEKQYNEYDEAFRKKINTLDASEEDIDIARNERAKFSNIYEYAQDINKYVERLSSNKNILQRKFYIAFSYSKSEITASGNFSKDEIKEICRRELYTRANTLTSSLMSCSVVSRTLTSEELIELLFTSYNRDDERLFDVTEALDADFYRLYSTSKDIYDKKREKIQEEISKEAVRRVQDAIRSTVRQDQIKTPEEVEDDFEESVDREAVNIIREAEIDREVKDELTNVIAQNHVINARKRAERRKRAKDNEEMVKKIENDGNELESDNIEKEDEIEEISQSDEIENTDIYSNLDDESNDSII